VQKKRRMMGDLPPEPQPKPLPVVTGPRHVSPQALGREKPGGIQQWRQMPHGFDPCLNNTEACSLCLLAKESVIHYAESFDSPMAKAYAQIQKAKAAEAHQFSPSTYDGYACHVCGYAKNDIIHHTWEKANAPLPPPVPGRWALWVDGNQTRPDKVEVKVSGISALGYLSNKGGLEVEYITDYGPVSDMLMSYLVPVDKQRVVALDTPAGQRTRMLAYVIDIARTGSLSALMTIRARLIFHEAQTEGL
jgi:hypothetical protein